MRRSLYIPELDTYVEEIHSNDVITDGRKDLICIIFHGDIEFYFDMDSSLFKIDDYHICENVILKSKEELDEAINGYYKYWYEENVLPTLERFMRT